MNYFKVSFTLKPYDTDAADLLAAFLADIGFESFVEAPEGMDAYVAEDNFDRNEIAAAVEQVSFPVKIEWEEELVEQQDWNSEWEKNYFQPLVLADGRCVIHATFHKDYPAAEYDITIDPKMAFGTGHHATTSMMVRHLFENDLTGKKVVDMGTGTGILAILAKKLGAKDVTGIEIDEFAFENARENAELNGEKVSFIHGDASRLEGMGDVDVFLANINRNIILQDLERYVATLAPEGTLFLSGFYETDVPVLEKALQAHGLRIASILTEGDHWASLKIVL